MYKLILVLLLATVLVTSTIATQEVLAKSKTHKKVDKFLRAETKGGDKMTDLCTVNIEVENKGNSSLKLKDCEPPEESKNKPPILVTSELKCITGFECQAAIEEAKDLDGSITQIIWSQTSGPFANFTVLAGNFSILFTPLENATYVFSVTAEDNDGATTTKPLIVISQAQDIDPSPIPECPNDQFWNGTACLPNPPMPTCDANEFFNSTSEMCEPIPIPEPPLPIPVGDSAKIIGIGDVECEGDGLKVLNQIKKENPTLVLNLGDLCYDSSLSNYLPTWGALGNLLACTIGNHDSSESGSSTITKQALEYCGNDYYVRQAGVLIVGLNTNGDLTSQKNDAVKLLSNSTFMSGTHIVVISSHKPICLTPPNTHHSVESKIKTALCEPLKNAIGNKAEIIFLSGHNHVMSKGQQGGIDYIQSGAGGRSHYSCGTNDVFKFCNNTKWGYWMIEVEPDGISASGFRDINGGIVN